MISRPEYMKKILAYRDSDFIKVITGVRRSGKSVLLKQLFDNLVAQNIDETHILYINFESQRFEKLKMPGELYRYVIKKMNDTTEKVYFLFDEIQEVDGWQKTVNSLRVDYRSDIYVTGSNASLLSGELATYLAGRYVEIKVYPLSFQEFLEFKADVSFRNVHHYYVEYRQFGGFPAIVQQINNDLKLDAMKGIYDSIIVNDVSSRGKLKDVGLLRRVTRLLNDSVGKPISVNKIANSLKSEGFSSSPITIDTYLGLLENAFLFYRVGRYDIRGREQLKTLAKYYPVDTGLRNVSLGKADDSVGKQLEMIVFMELKRRGYEVTVGKYDSLEVDFIARKQDDIQYIQVVQRIPENSTRETDNLLHLPTGYRKMVIVDEMPDQSDIDGIAIVNIISWLLEGSARKAELI